MAEEEYKISLFYSFASPFLKKNSKRTFSQIAEKELVFTAIPTTLRENENAVRVYITKENVISCYNSMLIGETERLEKALESLVVNIK